MVSTFKILILSYSNLFVLYQYAIFGEMLFHRKHKNEHDLTLKKSESRWQANRPLNYINMCLKSSINICLQILLSLS